MLALLCSGVFSLARDPVHRCLWTLEATAGGGESGGEEGRVGGGGVEAISGYSQTQKLDFLMPQWSPLRSARPSHRHPRAPPLSFLPSPPPCVLCVALLSLPRSPSLPQRCLPVRALRPRRASPHLARRTRLLSCPRPSRAPRARPWRRHRGRPPCQLCRRPQSPTPPPHPSWHRHPRRYFRC